MIILLQINYSEDHSEKILPLGILSVGSALIKHGFEVKLYNITEKEIDEYAHKIAEEKPEYVGISVMTGIQTMHSAQISKKIKKYNRKIPILWGGIHPSLMPQQCISEKYIDYVITGEGEEAIIKFTKELKGDKNFSNVESLVYKKDGVYKINDQSQFIQNLDDWRLDFSLLNIDKYIYSLDKYKRVIAYKTSRGCPFNCAFCYNNQFNQRRWRTWSIKTVVEDIEFLKKNYNIDGVKFYDDNFFVDKDRALQILEAIDLPSHLEIRIDFIDEEVASSLKKLKVFDMLIGLESGSDRLLKLIDKNFTVARMMEGVKAIANNNLHASYSFIVGLPTETEEEFWQTINLMYKIYKIHPQAGFTLGIYLPYPGSRMYQFSIEQGFKVPENTEEWGSIDRFRKNFDSPWVNAKKVWVIRECFKILSWKGRIFKKWFEFRIKNKLYFFPIDIYIIEYLAGLAIEERGFIGRAMRKTYNFLRRQYGSNR